MPIKKWIFQYAVASPIIFVLLTGVQYLKGRSVEYSVEFGVLWTFISIAVFASRRIYNYRKNIDCIICNDLPKNTDSFDNK